MTEVEVQETVERLRTVLANFSYRGIRLFDLVKVQLYLFFRGRMFQKRGKIGLLTGRSLSLAHMFLRNIGVSRKIFLDGMHVFIVDHLRKDFFEAQLDIIKHFTNEKVAILTSSKNVLSELKKNQNLISIYRSNQIISISPKNLFSESLIIAKIAKVLVLSQIDILTVIETLLACLAGVKYIDGYWNSLSPENRSIITLCDAHMHEHAITEVANKKGIKTYTLQHGMVSEYWAPVVSDKIFVWGETAKKELIQLDVPEEKIVVSGRLLFDNKLRDCLSKDLEIRKAFAKKYNLDENKLIVAYFATNWGPEENRGLLETFASILDLDIAPFIKLRPNFGEKEREEHAEWLRQYRGRIDVPMVIEEDIYEIFTAIDVLITCHSGAAVEAMAFNTVSIILDLYDYMKLPDILPHYHDCIVVQSKEELRSSIIPLINNKQELKRRKEIGASNARKYFFIHPDASTSGFIADYIRRQD